MPLVPHFRSRLRSISRILLPLLAATTLGACSALQFSYNNSDTLLRYMAWDYFELDHEQADSLQQRFIRLREWHRSSELPVYATLLQSASQRVGRKLTRADVDWAIGTLRSHYRQLAQRAAQDASPVLVTLKPEQFVALEKKLAKEDARYVREWMASDEKTRTKKRVSRMVDRIEEWTGNLNASQLSLIEKFVVSHPGVYEVRLEERRRRQRETVSLLKSQKLSAELSQHLGQLFSDTDTGRSEAYLLETRRWESDMASLILDIDAGLSTEQRARVVRRLERYANDFRALAAVRKAVVDVLPRTSWSWVLPAGTG